MSRSFVLPDIGSGLQEAEIVAWHVAVGDRVTVDQVLCEVETEKSVVEIPVPFDGVVLELAGPPGTVVEVGNRLVVIGESGERDSPTPRDAVTEPDTAPSPTSTSSPPAATAAGSTPSAPTPPPGATDRPKATPLVRRIARELDIDLADLAGTGPDGVITRGDVEAAAASLTVASPPPPSDDRRLERVRLSKLRRTIGAHMTDQWQQVPHITSHIEADATQLLRARNALSERLGLKVPIDALLIAAVAPALRRFPEMNAAIDGDEIVVRHYVDMGLAVGSDEGLVVPVIRDADRRSLQDLIGLVTDLTTRGRQRKLRPDEMGNQTFTVSNLGALRGWHATQVIPAGTTGILSFGRAEKRPVVRQGEITTASIMAISGTHDHRAHDGGYHMQFLNAVVEAIEEPALLLL